VLAGDDDPIIPVINARLMAALIPGAELVVVPGGGHLFLIEDAANAARLVVDFLDR
jgi:poly(3-hydroxyoctanoate) depolymerase